MEQPENHISVTEGPVVYSAACWGVCSGCQKPLKQANSSFYSSTNACDQDVYKKFPGKLSTLQVGELCVVGGKAQGPGLWEDDGDDHFITKYFLNNIYYLKDKEILYNFFHVTSHQILLHRPKV